MPSRNQKDPANRRPPEQRPSGAETGGPRRKPNSIPQQDRKKQQER